MFHLAAEGRRVSAFNAPEDSNRCAEEPLKTRPLILYAAFSSFLKILKTDFKQTAMGEKNRTVTRQWQQEAMFVRY
jgi:hypothetical protein